MEAIIILIVVLLPGVVLLFRSRYNFSRFSGGALLVAAVFFQLAGGQISDVVLGWGAFPGWFTAWLTLMILAWWYPAWRRNVAGRKAAEERIAAEAVAEQAALKADEKKAKRNKQKKSG